MDKNELLCGYISIIAKTAYMLRHIYPSVRPQASARLKDVSELRYWRIRRKSVEKLQIWLKSDKNIRQLHEDPSTFYCCRQHTFAPPPKKKTHTL